MFELIIGVALGIIVGFSVYTVIAVSVALNPKFMKWYTKEVVNAFNYMNEIDYDDLKKEVKESY